MFFCLIGGIIEEIYLFFFCCFCWGVYLYDCEFLSWYVQVQPYVFREHDVTLYILFQMIFTMKPTPYLPLYVMSYSMSYSAITKKLLTPYRTKVYVTYRVIAPVESNWKPLAQLSQSREESGKEIPYIQKKLLRYQHLL